MDVEGGPIGAVVWTIFIVILAILFKMRKRRSRIGAGASGTVYDMLNEDKRNAVELIVEERAEARDPEDAEGDLPQLEKPTKQR